MLKSGFKRIIEITFHLSLVISLRNFNRFDSIYNNGGVFQHIHHKPILVVLGMLLSYTKIKKIELHDFTKVKLVNMPNLFTQFKFPEF